MVLLVLWFDITLTDTHRMSRDQKTQIQFETTYYVHTAAIFITLNEQCADTKRYFTEVHNVFAFQKILTSRGHTSAD